MSTAVTSDVGVGRWAMVPYPLGVARVGSVALRLFIVLAARYADRDTGESYPSRQTLAAALSTSVDSIDRAVKELVALGVLEVERRKDEAGDFTSNLYRLIYARSGSQEVAAPTRRPVAARMRHRTRSSMNQSTPIPPKGVVEVDSEDLFPEYAAPVDDADAPPVVEEIAAGFDEFWDAWPRKDAKRAAERAWRKLSPDRDLRATILAAIAVQRSSRQWTKDAGAFIPLPATWLNGRRWEDESAGCAPIERPARNVLDELRRELAEAAHG